MKTLIRFLVIATAFSIVSSFADPPADNSGPNNWFKSIFSTGEYVAEETYISDANVKRGTNAVRGFDENDTILRYVATPRISAGVLRIGAEWERFSFAMPNSLLPDTLQSTSLVLGLDTQFSDSILIRVEAQPGLYGTDHLNFDDVNMPFIAGGTYIYNPSVQFIVGVSVDIERKYPVIPVAGIRWKIARDWVLNAVLPEPRIEYGASRNLTLYLGANLKETNFRVDENFGTAQHNPALNHAMISLHGSF
jgi:hypothetical protein